MVDLLRYEGRGDAMVPRMPPEVVDRLGCMSTYTWTGATSGSPTSVRDGVAVCSSI